MRTRERLVAERNRRLVKKTVGNLSDLGGSPPLEHAGGPSAGHIPVGESASVGREPRRRRQLGFIGRRPRFRSARRFPADRVIWGVDFRNIHFDAAGNRSTHPPRIPGGRATGERRVRFPQRSSEYSHHPQADPRQEMKEAALGCRRHCRLHPPGGFELHAAGAD